MGYSTKYIKKKTIKEILKNKSVDPFLYRSLDSFLEEVFREVSKQQYISRREFYRIMKEILEEMKI